MQQAILNETDSPELAAALVWVSVMPTDDAYAAALQAKLMPDQRVTHFTDPEGHVGRRLVPKIITEGPAWDTYLFYARGATWEEAPPEPLVWYHQLAGRRDAAPSRYRTGDELRSALTEALREHLEPTLISREKR